MNNNLSNLLTISRIAIIPIILVLIIFKNPITSWVAFILFVIAGITDFIDGYLARLRKEETDFGTFFDPIADKLLVSSVILVLTAIGTIQSWLTIPRPPDIPAIASIFVGLGLTFLLMLMRMNIFWWPLHPAGFAISSSWSMNVFWFSILVSSVLKLIILIILVKQLYLY